MKKRIWASGSLINALGRKEISHFREGIHQAIAQKTSPKHPPTPQLRQMLERRYLTHPAHSDAALKTGYEKGHRQGLLDGQQALLEAAEALTLRAAQVGSKKRSKELKPNGSGKSFASGGAATRSLHR